MAKEKYLQAPLPSKEMPKGIPYIIANEAAERFSFYGMKTILTIFMTQYLMTSDGRFDVMSDTEATKWFHVFTSAVYFTPIFGALLSDIILAKYKTIISLSVVYCLGHLVLALDDTRWGLALGLMLISCGSGGIKPCVSAHVGDQFGKTNQHLLPKIFRWFYFSINLGSFISTLLTPYLLNEFGPHVAFGVPGALMLIATLAFWAGRYKFVHIPPGGVGFIKETLSGTGLKVVFRLAILYILVSMFWALFDQTGSSWVLQAEKMDRYWLRFEWFSSQIQAANPLLVMIMIPIFAKIIYPGLNKIFRLTPLRKISIGLFVAIFSFVVIALAERKITGGDIMKYSSKSKIESLSSACLIDDESNGLGWSSSVIEDPNLPQEIVIRLRERKAWTISSISIDPATTLGHEEILETLTNLIISYSNQGQIDKSKQLQSALREAKQAIPWQIKFFFGTLTFRSSEEKRETEISTAQDVKLIAQKALNEINADTKILDDSFYYPKEVAIYAADFTNQLVPKLIYELKKNDRKQIDDVDRYAQQKDWNYIGTLDLSDKGDLGTIEFPPLNATHVYFQIRSNHGGNRVKIGEIQVLTTESIPAASEATANEVWPNVAAIGYKPSIAWQFIAYIILTAAEVMVSITCLEFSYTQAPRKMKSFIMSVFLLSISLGNAITAAVNAIILNADGSSKLPGTQYFWLFAIMMLLAALLFIPVATRYRETEYIQEEAPADAQEESPGEG